MNPTKRASWLPAVTQAIRAHYYLIPSALLLFILPVGHTTALRMILLVLTAVVAALEWKRSNIPRIPLLPGFVLCAIVALASVPVSTDPGASLEEIKKEIGYGVLVFVSYFSMCRGAKELAVLVAALLSSILVLGTYALWADIQHQNLNFDGWHGGVLNYTVFVATVFPVLVCLLLYPGASDALRRMAAVGIPLMLLTAFLTENRMVWVAVAASSLAFVAMYTKLQVSRTAKLRLLVAITVLVLASFVALAVNVAQRFGTDAKLSSIVALFQEDPRFMLWRYGIEEIRERPLSGSGFGRMLQADAFRRHFGNVREFVHAHNMFINYGVQMGVPGVVAYLFLFGCVVAGFLRFYRSSDRRTSLIGVTGLAMVIAVLCKSMVDDQFIRHNALLFWTLAGMGLGYGTRRLRNEFAPPARRALGPD